MTAADPWQGYRVVGVGGLALAFGLACAGGAEDAPTDEAPTDEAPADQAPTDEVGDDEDGDDDDDEGRREARNDCRLGLEGVLVGVPGWRAGDHPAHTGPLKLRAQPRDDGRVVMELDKDGTVFKPEPAKGGGEAGRARAVCHQPESRDEPRCLRVEYDREVYGLPVYQQRNGWAQVALGPSDDDIVPVEGEGCRKRAWVELDAPLKVLPVEALVEQASMTYTLPSWDGVLYDGPDGAPKPSGDDGKVAFKKGRTARAGGRVWYQVTLIDTHCDTQAEKTQGWLPVTDADGRLQVWFENGC